MKPNRLSVIAFAPDGVPSGTPVAPVQGSDGTGGTQATGSADPTVVKLQQELNALKEKAEKDIAKLKSTYDKKLYEQQQQYERMVSERTSTLDDALLQRMSAEEQVEYMRQKLQQEQAAFQQQREQSLRQMQEQQAIQNAIQAYQAVGISMEELDTSSLDAVARSGWLAVQERLTGSRPAETSQSPGTGQEGIPSGNQPAPRQNATQVLTTPQQGSQPPAANPEALLKRNAQARLGKQEVDWTETLKLIDRGELDPNEVFKDLD